MAGIPELGVLGYKAHRSSHCQPLSIPPPRAGNHPGAMRCKPDEGGQAGIVGSMSRPLTSTAEVNDYIFFFLVLF